MVKTILFISCKSINGDDSVHVGRSNKRTRSTIFNLEWLPWVTYNESGHVLNKFGQT